MFNNIFFILIFVLAFSVFAKDKVAKSPKSDNSGKVIIQQLDKNMDMSEFKKDTNYEVRLLKDMPKESSSLPDVATRDKMFKSCDVLKHMKGWDELDKDQFYMKARALKIAKLVKRYPKFQKGSLEKLKVMISNRQK